MTGLSFSSDGFKLYFAGFTPDVLGAKMAFRTPRAQCRVFSRIRWLARMSTDGEIQALLWSSTRLHKRGTYYESQAQL